MNPEFIEQQLNDHSVKGFLPANEASLLFEVAATAAQKGSLLEIGSYCGRSAVYLAHAAQQSNQIVYSVDHHRGSEEHQLGEGYHDGDLFDSDAQRVDSLPEMRKNLRLCNVEDVVVPVVARSEKLARYWATPLAFIFVDGGHSEEQAKADCLRWVKHLQPDGVLAIHDIYETPEEGGQAPLRAMEALMAIVELEIVARESSLVILRLKT